LFVCCYFIFILFERKIKKKPFKDKTFVKHLNPRRRLIKIIFCSLLFADCLFSFLSLMLFSRSLFPRIKFYFSFRFKSTDINLIDELNRIKSKDLSKIFNDEQIQKFLKLKRTLGGKFHSLQQLQNEPNLQIDCKYFPLLFVNFSSICFS
jgi:hypothetical protein